MTSHESWASGGSAAMRCRRSSLGAAALLAPLPRLQRPKAGSRPSPIQFIIPAGTGGGADQMARFIQGVVAKNNLMKQPIITVNKGGGAGAEGFLEVKKSAGDPHTIIITLSNLFTTPYATGVPFSWKDMTPGRHAGARPVRAVGANADAPYKTAKEYIDAVKAGDDKTFKMGGTGSKQEDQIITVALEKLTAPKKFTYIPYAGGGAVAVQLVGKHINSTVNNPDRGRLAVEGRRAAAAVHLRRQAQHLHAEGHRHDGLVRHPDLQGIGRRHRVPDAARHLHVARREARAGRLLRRPVQEGDGDGRLEEVHGAGRVQPDLHVRRPVQDVGRGSRQAATTT